jgi:hypothetical protein
MWVHEIESDELSLLHDEHPPVTDAGGFDLGHGVRLERLAQEGDALLMNACEPRGHFYIGARQFGHRYAYVFEPSSAAVREDRTDATPTRGSSPQCTYHGWCATTPTRWSTRGGSSTTTMGGSRSSLARTASSAANTAWVVAVTGSTPKGAASNRTKEDRRR